jgi:hypothetical protein
MSSLKEKEEEITIAETIRKTIPLNAVFIQPFENTELKFYSQRSSYVEFKANVRHQSYVGEWYSRIHEVYGVDYFSSVKGFELQSKANECFEHLSVTQLNGLKAKGVTHILTRKQSPPAMGKLVIANKIYAVYQL